MAAYISFQPSDFFNTVLYTGNAAANSVTGVGFTPNFVWFKSRTSVASYQLIDSVRGNSSSIVSSSAAAAIDPTGDGFTSLDSDGYTFNGSGGGGNVNAAQDFVAWNWKGGTTSGIATNGSTTITPSAYSFSQTAGFSVIKYSGNSTGGAKVAHGLGATPAMVMVKNLGGTDSWMVYHQNSNAVPEDYLLQLNTTGSVVDNTMWNDTAPDAVNLTLGTDNGVNGSYDYVAYSFAEKKGYSKFGSYIGNNNVDGPMIYTGFRPAWVLFKRYDNSENWSLYDNKRGPINVISLGLRPNIDNIESNYGGSNTVDFLSNGFKIREGGTNINNGTYIYSAFAEYPLVSSNSKSGVAR